MQCGTTCNAFGPDDCDECDELRDVLPPYPAADLGNT